MHLPGRATAALRRTGPIGLARRATELARERLYLKEAHVWYCLDLTGERPQREMPEGVLLRHARADELDRVEEVGQDAPSARDRAAGGNDLWLAIDDGGEGGLLFACWIFRGEVPVLAAPDGTLQMPADMVCLEDSVSAPAARGRGIAPASWAAIANELAGEGLGRMITKVGVENAPSRKAVTKAGFVEVGVMELTRVAGLKRTSVEPLLPTGDELRRRIAPAG